MAKAHTESSIHLIINPEEAQLLRRMLSDLIEENSHVSDVSNLARQIMNALDNASDLGTKLLERIPH